MIPFNRAPYIDESMKYVQDALKTGRISGDCKYTGLCSSLLEKKFKAGKVLMTTSCTAALEMAALLLNIKEGDEVIMPSYTFVSTANAFVMYGAKPVFVDIRPDTMNIDENLIENAITDKTKAIVVVHYAGVACEMDKIMEISQKYDIPVVEDAAQGVMATYNGKALGTIGTFGCYSFHETKNYTMGEGGAIVINDDSYIQRAEIIREKGTNRARYYRGEVDKYTWVDIGASFLPSDINVAYLYGQLEVAEKINEDRINTWNKYYTELKKYTEAGIIELPSIPDKCVHNAHMFYIKFADISIRSRFIAYMKEKNIGCVFHYVPLHSSEAGINYSRFDGEDRFTTKESERLVRLPLYYNMAEEDINTTIFYIKSFIEEL